VRSESALSNSLSQSLSLPSQISVEEGTFWLQRIAPPEQSVMPAEQTPGLPVVQAMLPPGLPSSTAPLQLLSRPSQLSVPAGVF